MIRMLRQQILVSVLRRTAAVWETKALAPVTLLRCPEKGRAVTPDGNYTERVQEQKREEVNLRFTNIDYGYLHKRKGH
jgi:hypothetical protein